MTALPTEIRTFRTLPSEAKHYFRVFYAYTGHSFFLYLALTALAGAFEVIGISLFIPLLDQLGFGSSTSANLSCQWLFTGMGWVGIPHSLGGVAILVATLIWLKGAFTFLQIRTQARILADLLQRLRHLVVADFTHIRHAFYASRPAGYFNNIVTVETTKTANSFSHYSSALANAISAAFCLVGVLYLEPTIALGSLVFGFLYLFLFRRLRDISLTCSRAASREDGQLQSWMIQMVLAFRYLQATGGFHPIRKRVDQIVATISRLRLRQETARGLAEAVGEPVAVSAALLYLVASHATGKPLAVAIPVLFLVYRAVKMLSGFQNTWQKFQSTRGGVDTYEEARRTFAAESERQTGENVFPLCSGITCENIHFRHADQPVLAGLELTFAAGRMSALVGESGTGKTTLLGLLAGLDVPESGQLRYDGKPYSNINLQSLRQHLGYVPQDCIVFAGTIAFNIAMADIAPDDTEALSRVHAAALQAGIATFIDTLPLGYWAIVGDRGITLSGGQRQRLHIARELYRGAEILLLDEATSSLDSEAEAAIQQSIEAMRGKMTLVVVAHRLATIRNADVIHVLHQGRAVESGTFSELAARPDSRFAALLAHQRLT